MEYTKISLESDSSGIELICRDVTNIFTKVVDDLTNTVGVHKYKDLITGEIIYTGLDPEKSDGKLEGYFIDFISSSDARKTIAQMTDEDKIAYVEYVQSMKNECSIKKGPSK